MTDAADAPEYLRIPDVAERYGFKERFIRQLIADKTIPYYKPSKLVYINRAEFEAWLAEQRIEAL